MSLQKMKELEDAKTLLAAEGQELVRLNKERRYEVFNSAKHDFETYFKEQGFNVSTTNKFYTATYGNIVVNLTFPEVEESYIGAYSVWELEFNKKKYRVVINELGHYPSITTKFSTSSNNEDEKIQREIEDVKERALDIQKRVAEFPNVQWGYGLSKIEDKLTNNKYPQFATFKELLEELSK